MNFSRMRSREAKRTMGWDEELKTAVRKKRWKEMSSLLNDNDYSDSGVELFITACEQNSAIPFDREILSRCSSEQRDRLLKIALYQFRPFLGGGSWKEVKVLLEASIYSSSSVEQLVIACETYEKIPVDLEILSHCSEEQKDRLLKTALKPGTRKYWIGKIWPEVKVLLQDINSVELFVTACEQNRMIHVDHEILSHCSSGQKDRLLKTAVKLCNQSWDWASAQWRKGERWSGVDILLRDTNYSSSSVEQLVTACEEYKVIHVDGEILSHCSCEQMDRLMKIAVRINRWKEVASLLRDSNYSSSSVEQFVAACQHYEVIHVDPEILSHCSSEQRDRLLKTAVKMRSQYLDWHSGQRWSEVKILLQASNYSSSSVEQFVTACEQHDVINVDGEILSHCSSDQKDRLLKTAVSIRRWKEVASLLQDSNYSSSSVEQFVTACDQNDAIYVDREILSHCSLEQLNRLLETSVKVCRWSGFMKIDDRRREVDILLQYLHYSSSVVEQFVAACEEYEVIHVDGEILSRCSLEQKDRLLKTALKLCRSGDRWNDVKIVLQDNNYSSSNVEMFIGTCEQYNVIHIDGEILSHCSLEQRKRLLETAVKTERWVKVEALLELSGYNSIVVEEFVTACEQHGVIHANKDLLSHCSSQQHGRLLETGVGKKRWEGVDGLLQYLHYSASFVEQFVTACEKYGVVHDCPGILFHCTTEQLDRLLTLAITLEEWSAVGRLLEAGGSHEKRLWVIEQACQMSDCQSILPHLDDDFLSLCNTQQLDRLLTAFTKKRRWGIVEQVFKAGGSHEKRVWAIEQSCDVVYNGWRYLLRHVDEDFLSQCNTQQLDCLLTAFTTITQWQIVGKVLKAGGSHENRVWAIEQASLKCQRYDRNVDNYYYDDDDDDDDDDHFMMYILPHMNDDFLSQCSSQQLDRLLTTFTTTGRWQLVDTVLKAGGSHEKRVWAITQACDKHIYCYMLSHITNDLLTNCTTEQLDTLLTTVTRNRWWDIIDKVLRAGGSPAKRVCVFKEVCQTADHLDFQRYILPHCDGQLYNHITNPHTQSGLTVLFSAMLNEHCPRRMVAECIRLGFSTHQPPTVMTTTTDIAETITSTLIRGWWDNHSVSGMITSPFLLAVVRWLPVVAHMLCESGSCSYTELLHLYPMLLDLSDPHTEDGRKLIQGEYLTDRQKLDYFGSYSERYKAFMNTLTLFLPYLREMASTPRSLESLCRLVISHCLTVGGGHERAMKQLPLPEGMKDYLLFSDLTDPDYQPQMHGTMSDALLQQE